MKKDVSLLARVVSHLASVQELSDAVAELEGKVGEAERQRGAGRKAKDGDSSSSSSDEEEGKRRQEVSLTLEPASASPLLGDTPQSREGGKKGVNLWRSKVHGLMRGARMKKIVVRNLDETRDKRAKNAWNFMVLVVVLSCMETETKSATFHMSAVGLYAIDGQPYQFRYSLFLTCIIFFVKLGLGPLHNCMKKSHRHKRNTQASPKGWLFHIIKWALLFGFTGLEMLSTALGNYGLTRTPTSIFVVCKTSKFIFVAVVSVALLGKRLKSAQWASMGFVSAALVLALFAEGGGTNSKAAGVTLDGPIILIVSELVHATMLVSQEIAVNGYWPNAMALMSWSAAVGIPMTLSTMYFANSKREPTPPYEPMNDTRDVFVMMFSNPALGLMLWFNVFSHIAMDVSHIWCLKYMDALTRSLADAIKFALMWALGKTFWFSGLAIYQSAWPNKGVLAVLSESWKPYSWLMIPIIVVIAYALLVYKSTYFIPVEHVMVEGGTYEWKLKQAPDENQVLVSGLNESFYADFERMKRIQKHIHAAVKALQATRKLMAPKNQWQKRINVRKVLKEAHRIPAMSSEHRNIFSPVVRTMRQISR